MAEPRKYKEIGQRGKIAEPRKYNNGRTAWENGWNT